MTTVVLNTVTRKVEAFSSARDVQARAEIADHKAAADPHPQYLADANLAEVALSGDAGDLTAGTVPDARMPNWTGYSVASRTALEGANVPAAVVGLRLLGHAVVGDGGGAHYKRVAAEPVHPHKIQSADGAWWEELFAVEVTVNIPSDFATLQEAMDRLSKQPVRRGARIIVNIESGHALTAGFTVENGDYSKFTITSDDAEVPLDAGWPAGTAVAEGVNARMPDWGILVNCSGRDTGPAIIVSYNSSLRMLDANGVKNANGHGLFVHTNSEVVGNQAILTGCATYNALITHLSRGYLERANFTGSTGSANVYVSRGSILYAGGADFSTSVGNGLLIRRSTVVIIPFGSSTNTRFDDNGTGGESAILASDHSTLIAHERSGVRMVITNAGLHGVHALHGTHVDIRGTTFDTVAGDAVRVQGGAQAIINGNNSFTAVTGDNLSQIANVLTGNGVIYNAAEDAYPIRGNNANGSFTRYEDGTQVCWGIVDVTLDTSSNNVGHTVTWPAAFVTSSEPLVATAGAHMQANNWGSSADRASFWGMRSLSTDVGIIIGINEGGANWVGTTARVMYIVHGRWF